MRVLIIEDEPRIARGLIRLLKSANYVVDQASDGIIGLKRLETNTYDAIVLDIGLPEITGIEVCQELRNRGDTTPVLMLTGYDTTSEKVAGLNAGADDYLIKPYNSDELLARLRALMRRPQPVLRDELAVGDLVLDVVAREVARKGERIQLMPKEFALLEYLMRRAGEAISKDDLLQHVWGIYSRNSSNRLEVYIRYLREKIDEPFDQKMIETVRGTGYKISAA